VRELSYADADPYTWRIAAPPPPYQVQTAAPPLVDGVPAPSIPVAVFNSSAVTISHAFREAGAGAGAGADAAVAAGSADGVGVSVFVLVSVFVQATDTTITAMAMNRRKLSSDDPVPR
jgi:hypothetical protein